MKINATLCTEVQINPKDVIRKLKEENMKIFSDQLYVASRKDLEKLNYRTKCELPEAYPAIALFADPYNDEVITAFLTDTVAIKRFLSSRRLVELMEEAEQIMNKEDEA